MNIPVLLRGRLRLLPAVSGCQGLASRSDAPKLAQPFSASTKDRQKLIAPTLEAALWSYMGGIARSNRMKPIGIGGIEDHAHALLAIPTDLDVAKAVQLIKGGSSKWFRGKHCPGFGWQQGYGAFSVSASQQGKTVAYILNQRKHHEKMDFKAEYIAFLKKHRVEYDPRYVFA